MMMSTLTRRGRRSVASAALLSLTAMLATTLEGVGATSEKVPPKRLNRFSDAHATANDGETLEDYVVRVRRELHRVPETCFQEHLTAGIIVRELELIAGRRGGDRDGGDDSDVVARLEILATGVGGRGFQCGLTKCPKTRGEYCQY